MEHTTFSTVVGHAPIQNRILTAIKSNRLPHAYLFYGNEGTGKDAMAIEVAKLINCDQGPLHVCGNCTNCKKIANLQHPDIRFIFPIPSSSNVKLEEIGAAIQQKAENPYRRYHFPKKNVFIGIDTIRDLKNEAKFKLYEGRKKVFIISEADEMRPEAANALLKMLEEPPDNVMLILTTSKIHRLLPTIRSRCQLVHFPKLPGDFALKVLQRYLQPPPENLPKILRLAQDNIKLAFDFVEQDVLEMRNDAVDFLRKLVLIEKSRDLQEHINKITDSKDRKAMGLILYFILTWFRDAIQLKMKSSTSAPLFNEDLQNSVNKFVIAYPNTKYIEAVEQVQIARSELEDPRNLNPTLIFTHLAIKLNSLIRK
ncbi:MAG: AAA family ATPase [Calditrichia bacterium]